MMYNLYKITFGKINRLYNVNIENNFSIVSSIGKLSGYMAYKYILNNNKLKAIASAQKENKICAFIDAEHAFDPLYAKNLGIDLNTLFHPLLILLKF